MKNEILVELEASEVIMDCEMDKLLKEHPEGIEVDYCITNPFDTDRLVLELTPTLQKLLVID